LAQFIRNITDNGKQLAQRMYDIMTCETGRLEGCKVTQDHKIQALRWLADRAFGKAVDTLLVGGNSTLSDIILQAHARRQALDQGGGGESIKDAESKVIDVPAQVEESAKAKGSKGKARKSRDSKRKASKRGDGGRH
jgi:hypothetical protein